MSGTALRTGAGGKPATPPRLRLRVTAAAESAVRAGHPWVFGDSVREQNRPGQAGELAVIYDRKDQFLAVGLFDPESSIRFRVLHTGRPVTIDAPWWQSHLEGALNKRNGWFDADTNGFRWINGESDGWPGLVADRYDRTLVLKIYMAAWLPRLTEVVGLFMSAPGMRSASIDRLVLRLSRNIQETARRSFGYNDGQILTGPALEGPVTFLESGLRFESDVLKGQKTGFFLDQRDNRRRVQSLAAGREVLNAFSFSGGFSLYAARGGARSVTDLDISAHALAAAERNWALNRDEAAVARCRREAVKDDAFEWLAKGPARRFDLAILDPPSLAKRESERAGAIRAYQRLAESGIQRLNRDGVLVACSCSAHVSAGEFFQAVRQAAARSGRDFQEIATTSHAPDHAASFKEAEYLKGIFLRLK